MCSPWFQLIRKKGKASNRLSCQLGDGQGDAAPKHESVDVRSAEPSAATRASPDALVQLGEHLHDADEQCPGLLALIR